MFLDDPRSQLLGLTRFSRSMSQDMVQPQSGVKVAAEEFNSYTSSLIILITLSELHGSVGHSEACPAPIQGGEGVNRAPHKRIAM